MTWNDLRAFARTRREIRALPEPISQFDRRTAALIRELRSLPTATNLPVGARVWGEDRD